MIFKNLEIRTQLIISLAILLLFVVGLGFLSYKHSLRIHMQTELMYEHPMQVTRALGKLNTSIVSIQRDMRDLLLTENELEMNQDLMNIFHAKEDAEASMNVIADQYLGPVSDIDSLMMAFMKWNNLREETVVMIMEGKEDEASVLIRNFGQLGGQASILLKRLELIENFAGKKSGEFYANSSDLAVLLNRRLLLIVVALILISAIIFYFLMRNIRTPLDEMILATRKFHEGDLDARSSYKLNNEFGVLSDSFNELTGNIQQNIELSKNTEVLERLMLREDDAGNFFRAILHKFCEFTGAQMAAAYLLSDDKKTYYHFESIGITDKARQSFSATQLDGEFGPAIASRSIQHIKNLREDQRFIFSTVSGDLTPREIITIPIEAGDEVIAIISLATVNSFSNQATRLLHEVLIAMSTRVEGVLAFRKIREISDKLELQNNELELQKTELITQSARLTAQNTELEIQKKELAEASRLKTNFLSNMSHELRTPLNSVIALTGVLIRRLAVKIPEEEHSYLQVIERNGKNLLALINDILDISRIESGREELDMTRFDVNELVAESINMINPQARQKNVELKFSPGDIVLNMSTDAEKLSHIIQNIISNAVKFTEQGTVTVKTDENNDQVFITVTDTGIGIAENQLPYIFDEFRQADSSTSRRFGGTGLGLALARKYTRLLGGEISVSSTLNQGSEFTLSLPLKYNPVINKGKPNSPASLTFMIDQPARDQDVDFKSKSILLVEDSEPAIIQIKDLMDEQGINILIARDGKEALDLISQSTPDAMILDLMMPGIDGFQVLRAVRESEITSHLPVLILTAKFVTKSELSFLKANNIHQLIRKGDVNLEELVNVVKGMLYGA